jgi:hypothetical protein
LGYRQPSPAVRRCEPRSKREAELAAQPAFLWAKV